MRGVPARDRAKLPLANLDKVGARGVRRLPSWRDQHVAQRVARALGGGGGLVGAVIKDPVQDAVVWKEYLETVVKERDGWKDLYRAAREVE